MKDLTHEVDINKIGNVVENFGWEVIKTETTENLITLTIQKDLLLIPLNLEDKK